MQKRFSTRTRRKALANCELIFNIFILLRATGSDKYHRIHQAGPAVIKTTLEDLFKNSNVVSLFKSPAGVALLKNAGLQIISVPELSSAATKPVLSENIGSGASKKGFLDLPSELRTKIYEHLWIIEKSVDFNATPSDYVANRSHSYSGQFLRTCKTIYNEGTPILYGENSFHFSRDIRVKGRFHDAVWKEVGYKGVRRFLESIGPDNVSQYLLTHDFPS